jgi:hypothetical protein
MNAIDDGKYWSIADGTRQYNKGGQFCPPLVRSSDFQLIDIELLLMQRRITFDDDGALGEFFHLIQKPPIVCL